MKNISRRSFLKGSAALGAVAAMGSVSVAAADAKAITFADTVKWDAEYDVVVMGMGAAGMCAAKTAADNGARVLIAEKMSEGLSGGNTKVCGQLFAYAYGDKESAKTYYKALAAGRDVPEAMVDTISEGVANMADTLANEFGFNREEFVDWTGKALGMMSPEYPEMPCSDKMSLWSTHMGFSDGYLYQGFKQNVLDRADKIDVWYESPAKKLIQDPASKTVVGVVVERGGQTMNVRALGGVVIATGGFEANPEMVKQYLNVINYAPRGGQYNTGDGIKMAQAVGADLWHMPIYEGLFGFGSVTWPETIGTPCSQPGAMDALSTGAAILVGTDGDRFVEESSFARHGHLYENGIWENPVYPEKIWHIFDKTQKALIDEKNLIPASHVADVMEFDTIEEMAAALGCKPEKLKATIENFNVFATNGVDYHKDRPAMFMRPFDGEKYYAERMVSGLLNTQGGPRRNENAEVLDTEGNPIPNLYSAGECGGITSCMYQGGTNIAECITFGRIAGKNAAAPKAELPVIVGEAVESNPAKPGEITDVGAVKTFDTAENEYVTTSKGLMGDVTARVQIVDGKVAAVEVVEHSETPGIGTRAVEEMPAKFVGAASAADVDAIDVVSGASVTSNALKDCVKQALALAK